MKAGSFQVFVIALIAALGGFLFGFDTAVISGTTADLERLFSLDKFALGFTVAIALIGTIVGTIVVGKPADLYGRRKVLIYTAVIYTISAFGCAFSFSWETLLFARFLGGIGVGVVSVVGPMYIAEIAPAAKRGRLVGLFQFNVVFGILMAYFSNYIVGLFNLGDIEWRWKLGVQAFPSIIFFFALFFIPRSPRWLMTKGLVDEARSVLVRVGEERVEDVLKEIGDSIKADHGSGDILFSKKFSYPIFLAVSIAVFNQLSGINALLYYLNDIFSQAGFDKVSGDIQSVAVGATNLFFTMIAMSIIDKVGRKTLLLVGSIGTAVCLAGVSVVFFTNSFQYLLVYLLVGYIAFFWLFTRGSDLGLYQRGISKFCTIKRAGFGQFYTLGNGSNRFVEFPSTCCTLRRCSICLFLHNDGCSIRGSLLLLSRNKGKIIGTTSEGSHEGVIFPVLQTLTPC